MNPRTRILFGCVIAAGATVLAGSVPGIVREGDALALVLIGAAFISGLLMIELSSEEAESVTFAIVVAAQLTAGTDVAVAAAVAGELASAVRPPLPRVHRSAYNIAAHALAAQAAGALAPFGYAPGPDPALGLGPAVAASLVYFAVSSGLVAWGIAWSAGSSPRAVWAGFRWLAPHYPALALVGMIVALGAGAAGVLGVLVFCVPLVMSHYSVEIFTRRTKAQMRALEAANARLAVMNEALTETLASVVDARDQYLFRHSHHASAYTERIARRCALPEEEVQLARQAALLHDIGKVGIPEAILRKPAALDRSERAIMNSHAEIGAEIVARTQMMAPVAAAVRAHHERWDGEGYPDGLAGKQIPVAARILAVLEAFDAMISDRPYRRAMSKDDALAEIARCSGTQFDPQVVREFLAVVREEGTAWLSNSASSVDDAGDDLFLPKSLTMIRGGTAPEIGDDERGSRHLHRVR